LTGRVVDTLSLLHLQHSFRTGSIHCWITSSARFSPPFLNGNLRLRRIFAAWLEVTLGIRIDEVATSGPEFLVSEPKQPRHSDFDVNLPTCRGRWPPHSARARNT